MQKQNLTIFKNQIKSENENIELQNICDYLLDNEVNLSLVLLDRDFYLEPKNVPIFGYNEIIELSGNLLLIDNIDYLPYNNFDKIFTLNKNQNSPYLKVKIINNLQEILNE